jgi:hypothetical protein
MEKVNAAVALYGSLKQAEQAIEILRSARFPMAQLSIAGNQLSHDDLGHSSESSASSKLGPRWTKCEGMLSGSALFAEEDDAHVVVLGALVDWIASERNDGASLADITALGLGMSGAGIPRKMVRAYEKAVGRNQLVLIGHGTIAEVSAAKRFLWRTKPLELDQYAADAGTTLAGRSTW